MSELSSAFNRDSSGYIETVIHEAVDLNAELNAEEKGDTGQVTVGTSAVQITSETTAIKSVSIKSLSANTGLIYVGFSNAVTTSTGYELSARDSIEIDIDDLSDIWLISDTALQKVCYMYVV